MIPQIFLRKEDRPLCIGHRGAAALAPENTLASFVKAVSLGVDMIEFDVQLTQDEVPVVFHDEGLERTAGDWGDLASTPLEKLKQLDAGKWFSSSFKGEKVPTLEEALHYLSGKTLMYVELKSQKTKNEVLAEKAAELVLNKDLLDQAVVVSFDLELIGLVKKKDPRILTGVNFKQPDRILSWVEDEPQRVDILCPRISVLDDSFFERVEPLKKTVYTWVSDKPEALKKWGEHPKISAIATNNPEIFNQVFPK